MFIPEYSITPKILKNIALMEYSKGIIENTTILPMWEKQLEKDALTRSLHSHLGMLGINVNWENVKKSVDGLIKDPVPEISNILDTYDVARDISINTQIDELEVKYIHKNLTKNIFPKSLQGSYRSVKIEDKPEPEEILAKMSEVFDWLENPDAKENHPAINSAIIRGVFEVIQPFEQFNDITGEIASRLILAADGYDLNWYISQIDYYYKNRNEFEQYISSLSGEEPDFTKWIEFYTRSLAFESVNVKEKILLLEKDTKVAKVSGRTELTDRQETIIAYLQDYGMIQNKDFSKIFPDISEDSVLRDLKTLMDKKIVIKKGSTKSSRYELKL